MRIILIRPITLIAALWGVSFAGCVQSGSPTAEFISVAAETEPASNQPPETQTVFYYYADGELVLLTPSLEWIAVRFASAEVNARKAALLPYSGQLGDLEKTRDIPAPELTLLPLREGISLQDLLELARAMRSDEQDFIFANPLFETDDVWMAFGDRFLAGFSTELTRAEIDRSNARYGVAIVSAISGQDNVFLLKALPGSGLDALTAANLYQESGIALHAAPDFIRITK